MICPKCRNEMDTNAKFCSDCGTLIITNNQTLEVPTKNILRSPTKWRRVILPIAIVAVCILCIGLARLTTKKTTDHLQTSIPTQSASQTQESQTSTVGKPIIDSQQQYPVVNTNNQTPRLPDVSTIINPSITQPIVRTALENYKAATEDSMHNIIEKNNLQHFYPIQLIYSEFDGNLYATITVNHKFGSDMDVEKGSQFNSISSIEIRNLYQYFSYSELQAVKQNPKTDGTVLDNLYHNPVTIYFADRDKKIAVGVDVFLQANPQGMQQLVLANQLRYFANGEKILTNPLLERNAPFTAIGNSQDGPEWKPIDEFFGLPY